MASTRLFSAVTLLGVTFCCLTAGAEEKRLNVYNWTDYISEGTIEAFETETGIKVVYDVFDSNEILEAKLLTGSTGYDIVVPSASFLERQIKAGVFRPLDTAKLSNLRNADPAIRKLVSSYDPGNRHAVTYLWGTTGLGINVAAVTQRIGDLPTDSWSLVFDPAIAAKLADCGVTFLDDPTDVIGSALNYLGLDPNSEAPEDLKKAEALLAAVRPHIRYFHSSQYVDDLANAEICVAMGYSGDVLQAANQAAEAGGGVKIEYVIPREGASMWFDMLAVPADAPHPENAHAFIDYLLRADVAADITNYVFYANANAASLPLVKEEVSQNPGIYPVAATKAKLFTVLAKTARFDRILNRTWTRLKAGK